MKNGFRVTGVDNSEVAQDTWKINYRGRFVLADLSDEALGGHYDVVVGGPPCKPWSAINTTKRGKSHDDYDLLSRFFLHVEKSLPRIFILENVPPLGKDPQLIEHLRILGAKNYSVSTKVLMYGDFGAPTRRHRFFVFGIRNGNASKFIETLSRRARESATVKDAIWKLRHVQRGEAPDHDWPELRTISKYRKFYKTGKYGWYALKWNEPAPSFGNVMKTYILHPDAFNGGATRVISVREALNIMGFGERFRFPKGIGLGSRYQMVADAVSPAVSNVLAKSVRALFDGERWAENSSN